MTNIQSAFAAETVAPNGDEGEPLGPALVLRGARERLSPILMTALATGLALVPLVVAGD